MKWYVIVTTDKFRGQDKNIFSRKKDAVEYAEELTKRNKNVEKAEVIKQGTPWF